MQNKVAIIGIYESKCEAKNRRDSTSDLIFETTSLALKNAGINQADIDTVVMAESDQLDGRLIGAMSMALPAHAFRKDEIRVEDDGASALALAYMRCLSGHFDVAVVVSWTMCSQTNVELISCYNFDPFFYRPIGLNWITSYAVQAKSYMDKWGINPEQAAKVTVKNRANALKNDKAHLRSKVTMEEVQRSEYVSWPLRRLNLATQSDGACALVLATEEKAKKLGKPLAWITGIGWSTDTYHMGDRNLWHLPSLTTAAKKAYAMAGIKDPLKEIDVAEISDVTSFQELMEYEALGFCGEGEGGKFIDSGAPFSDGKLPVNLSGGMLSSNPITAVGLFKVAEAALQVSGQAGERQSPRANVALAHGMSGICGQSNYVAILSK
ncbi:MAG: thiolase family protein [Dehalococcoidales bacterium]|nr:thiolase family protein [Dehalococcoidales bacterium]